LVDAAVAPDRGANRLPRLERFLNSNFHYKIMSCPHHFIRLGLTRPYNGLCWLMLDTLFPLPQKEWLEDFLMNNPRFPPALKTNSRRSLVEACFRREAGSEASIPGDHVDLLEAGHSRFHGLGKFFCAPSKLPAAFPILVLA